MERTAVLGLNMPAGNDYVDIEALNDNARKMDDFARSHVERHRKGGADPLSPEDIGAASTETYTATVTTAWMAYDNYYYQDIDVEGILATDNPIVEILCGSDNAANKLYSDCICKVFRITTSANSIRVWATEAISTAFPIQLKVVR